MLSQFDSQCRINLTLNFESIWLSMLSQFDSQCWVNLILNVEPIWLSMLSQFDSQCWANLTLNVEPIRLSMLNQFDSQCWVNLTQIFSSYPLYRVEFSFRKWLTFYLCQNDLIFFSQCIIACRHNYSELNDATPQASNQSIKILSFVCKYQILEYFL